MIADTETRRTAHEDPMQACFELRTYFSDASRAATLHELLEECGARLFPQHGMQLVGCWTAAHDPTTVVYLVRHDEIASVATSWCALRADPSFVACKATAEREGSLVKSAVSILLLPTPYSPSR